MSLHTQMHVGICGAGIGGLLAAIAIAQAGAQVTVLEGAEELGEIGAGIQMTPNAARLLRRWGVDKVIGNNLVRFPEVNMHRKDGKKVGWTPLKRIETTLQEPWWLVHRHHLHSGLVEVAKRNGCDIRIASRVEHIDHSSSPRVTVRTVSNKSYTFDLLIGADGLGSITRRTLFPEIQPSPPTHAAAYRAIVPYAQIASDPIASALAHNRTMDVWMAPSAYIIAYPINAGQDLNLVLSHTADHPVISVEDVSISDVHTFYADWDPEIARVVSMIKHVQRWPLLMTGPLPRWSSPRRNVVLLGDAAHSMVNHMAQGAATSMEDGAFLARCIREVIQSRGHMSLRDAVDIYERARMPLAHQKQQVSYLNGVIWHLSGGAAQEARDRAMAPELRGELPIRSPNLYGDPTTVLETFGYDAEAHADEEIKKWWNDGRHPMDERTKLTKRDVDKYVDWMLPEEHKLAVKTKL